MIRLGSSKQRPRFRDRAKVWYERRGLKKGSRHLVNIAALTLLGRSADLRDALDWAIERRVSVHLIREVFLQTMLFAGYPRALHAFERLHDVLKDRDLRVPPRRDRVPPRAATGAFYRRRGRELFEEIYRDDTNLVRTRISEFHPEFMDWISEDAYGKVLSRPFLELKIREMLSSCLLAVLGLPRQLTPHIRGALRAGASGRELSEAFQQLELFIPKRAVKAALLRLDRAKTTL